MMKMAERLDLETAATVRAMIGYIADDARIARHVGCSVEAVAAIRRQAPKPRVNSLVMRGPSPGKAHEELHDQWTRSAAEGSRQLLQALQRVYGSAGRPA
jgi:hypothetical protein